MLMVVTGATHGPDESRNDDADESVTGGPDESRHGDALGYSVDTAESKAQIGRTTACLFVGCRVGGFFVGVSGQNCRGKMLSLEGLGDGRLVRNRP